MPWNLRRLYLPHRHSKSFTGPKILAQNSISQRNERILQEALAVYRGVYRLADLARVDIDTLRARYAVARALARGAEDYRRAFMLLRERLAQQAHVKGAELRFVEHHRAVVPELFRKQ